MNKSNRSVCNIDELNLRLIKKVLEIDSIKLI